MKSLFRPTVATIDLQALRDNFRAVTALAPKGSFACPMIKANGYGHGLVDVAQTLRAEQASHLGVALIEEAALIREGGDKGSLLAFGLYLDRPSAEEALKLNVTVVANCWDQLNEMSATAKRVGTKTSARVQLEFNTGMNRHGFDVEDAVRLRQWFASQQELQLEGLCTHMMTGEDVGVASGHSAYQLGNFERVLAPFQGLQLQVHALNSSASIAYARRVGQPSPYWGIRPGIALYGAHPAPATDLQIALRPVLRWSTKIASIQKVSRGQTVSYDATWKAERDSVIGVIPCGYGDGYSRDLSNRGTVLCRETRVPQIGRVCMDCIMVDLTDVPLSGGELSLGEEVVLIGRQGQQEVRVEELAKACNTIPYEILTGIGPRVPRVHLAAAASREPA